MLSLEKVGALNLEKVRKHYNYPNGKYYLLVEQSIAYWVNYATEEQAENEKLIIEIMSDSFNRTINSLEKAKAINRKELSKEYRGVGSLYYDIVTEQMESSIPL